MSSSSPPTPPTSSPTPPTPPPVDFTQPGPPSADTGVNYTPGPGELNYTPGPPAAAPPPQDASPALSSSASATDAAWPGTLTNQAIQPDPDIYQGPGAYPSLEVGLYVVVQPLDSFTGQPPGDAYLSPPPLLAAQDSLSPPPLLAAQDSLSPPPLLAAQATPGDIPQQEGFYHDPDSPSGIGYVGPTETIIGPTRAAVLARQVMGNLGSPEYQGWATEPRSTTDVDRLFLAWGAIEVVPLAGIAGLGLGSGAVLSGGGAALETGAGGSGAILAAGTEGLWQAILRGSTYLYVHAGSFLSSISVLPGSISSAIFGSQLAKNAASGSVGEAIIDDLPGYQTKVESITGTAEFRILDALEAFGVVEVKNTAYLSLTKQLTDSILYAQSLGIPFYLVTGLNTQLSGPLQERINSGLVNWIPAL